MPGIDVPHDDGERLATWATNQWADVDSRDPCDRKSLRPRREKLGREQMVAKKGKGGTGL